MFFGLIDWIKSFFEKDNRVTFMTLEEVPLKIEDLMAQKNEELEVSCGKKMSEVRFLHSKITTLVKDIQKKEIESKENERFNRAAFTAKSHIEIQLMRTLEKIDPKDRGCSISDARAYCEETLAVLFKEIVHFRKSIAYTSVYLKDEMKELGETLQSFLENLQKMKAEFDDNTNYFESEKILEKIKQIRREFNSIKVQEEKVDQLKEKLEAKRMEKKNHEEKIISFSSGKEAVALKKLEEEKLSLLGEKQSLKTELSSLLATIDKPMQRFKQLCDSGRIKISSEEKNTLDSFLTNPILALRSDPKGETLKKVLVHILKAVEDDKIEFKDKEKEKKIASINDILAFDFFEKMFWRMNELAKKQSELDKEITDMGVFEQKQKMERKNEELDRNISELEETLKKESNFYEQMKDKLNSEKETVAAFISKLKGKTVIIKDD